MVGCERRDTEVLPDHVEQRLVVVEVGDGDAGDDGQRVKQPARKPGVLFQHRFHRLRFFLSKATKKIGNPRTGPEKTPAGPVAAVRSVGWSGTNRCVTLPDCNVLLSNMLPA